MSGAAQRDSKGKRIYAERLRCIRDPNLVGSEKRKHSGSEYEFGVRRARTPTTQEYPCDFRCFTRIQVDEWVVY